VFLISCFSCCGVLTSQILNRWTSVLLRGVGIQGYLSAPCVAGTPVSAVAFSHRSARQALLTLCTNLAYLHGLEPTCLHAGCQPSLDPRCHVVRLSHNSVFHEESDARIVLEEFDQVGEPPPSIGVKPQKHHLVEVGFAGAIIGQSTCSTSYLTLISVWNLPS
jgi:hypothetical protein